MRGKASTSGFEAMRVSLEKFENAGLKSVHSIDIGIVKSARYPRRKESESDPPTVAQVAVWNEYGTRGGRAGGGWGGPSPARPFMRNSMEVSKKDDRVYDEMRKGITPKSPNFDEKTAARVAGVMKRNMIEAMQDRGLAPNAPLTIKLKGSSQPLHDNALLRQSIDFRVNKTEPDDSDGGTFRI